MESKTNAPSFTVSLRGYDRMEVDEYLDSLAEALGQVEQAEERVHGLQALIDRLNARIADLEDRIRSDVPKSGALLGERIAIMLRSAEETAAETVERAEAQAADLAEKARQNVAAAEDQARGAVQRGEEQARHLEAGARAEAAEIIAEAESRASARTRQIEQWAEQVISHTRAEEARMLKEQQHKREQLEGELRALAEQRDAVAASISELRDQLARALETVGQAAPVSLPAVGPAAVIDVVEADQKPGAMPGAITEPEEDQEPRRPEAREPREEDAALGTPDDAPASFAAEEGRGADDDEMPWPAAFRPVNDVDEPARDDRTGGVEVKAAEERPSSQLHDQEAEGDERDEFDTKFDAWVTGSMGPQHFRRL